MTHAMVSIQGAPPALPTLLGQAAVRIPTGGKIRAGIKVLTKNAAEHPTAKAIYERGLAAHHSFETIERAIREAVPELGTPLIPKNVPWFTVRPDDFPNPQTARDILAAHGEDRGDGERRLYRFPVVFPADQWPAVMPHELVAWGANEKKFWSEYASDGRVRHCICYAPVPVDPTAKRAIRLFGGRKTTRRPDNGGLCDPERCREYQTRQCNLSGRFIFFIPGIKSIGAFELPTHSFYAMNAAIQKFETIAFMRGGRISGFLDRQRTSFFITKTQKEVPHIDENGCAVRVTHWIIELEAPIDVTALLRTEDDEAAALVAGERAARLLEGTGSVDPTAESAPIGPEVLHSGSGAHVPTVADDEGAVHDAPDPPMPATPATPTAQRVPPPGEGSSPPSLEQVINAAADFGIDAARYLAYAAKRWGPGWKINVTGRRRALAEIDRHRDDPDGFTSRIGAEIDGSA